jgi:hypothetical protein
MTSVRKLSLLNYEGDVLKVHYNDKFNKFLMIDEHGVTIEILSRKLFEQFLNGQKTLINSKGIRFNYSEEHKDAKPSQEKLQEFLDKNKRVKHPKTFTRPQVIKMLNRILFYVSDNGDSNITGETYMDTFYPNKKNYE